MRGGFWRTRGWPTDSARWFGGGFAEGTLATIGPDYLRRFIRETWRGELCHWSAPVCTPVFLLWNPMVGRPAHGQLCRGSEPALRARPAL